MAIEISPPVAGIGGGVILAGGGALAVVGGRELSKATALSQFASPPKMLPVADDVQRMLGATDALLAEVQYATRNGTGGVFGKIGAAKDLAKIDEGPLLYAARKLNTSSSELVTLIKQDLGQVEAVQAAVKIGGAKLAIGGVLAATGALLVANSVFDVK